MCNVTDVLWPQCRIHLDHFYKPGKKYLPSAGNHANRSGTNCLFKQRCHQGTTASPHQNLEGSFLSHVPRERSWSRHRALPCSPKLTHHCSLSCTSCREPAGQPRWGSSVWSTAQALPTHPAMGLDTGTHLATRMASLRCHLRPCHAEDTARSAVEFCSPSPSATHTPTSKDLWPTLITASRCFVC